MTTPIAPDRYIKLRRTASGLSIDDVAAQIAAEPHVPHRARAEWLELIEAGVQPMTLTTIVALRRVFPFSTRVLEALERIAQGSNEAPPQLCRICGCSWEDPCVDGILPCAWAKPDLCTACTPDEPAVDAVQAAA